MVYINIIHLIYIINNILILERYMGVWQYMTPTVSHIPWVQTVAGANHIHLDNKIFPHITLLSSLWIILEIWFSVCYATLHKEKFCDFTNFLVVNISVKDCRFATYIIFGFQALTNQMKICLHWNMEGSWRQRQNSDTLK